MPPALRRPPAPECHTTDQPVYPWQTCVTRTTITPNHTITNYGLDDLLDFQNSEKSAEIGTIIQSPIPASELALPGVEHHVTQRGNNRQDVFFTDDDRRFYLRTLREQTGLLDLPTWCRRYGSAAWKNILRDPLDEKMAERLHGGTLCGRPLGSDRFIAKLGGDVESASEPITDGRPRKEKKR